MAASDEFRLVSPAFEHEGRFPRKHTQEGQGTQSNISPPLEWYNVPEGAKSLALVVQDIDAPSLAGATVPWTHWLVENIPPTLKGLPEDYSSKKDELGGEFDKIREGINDWKVVGWRGGMLPSHGHRIEFKLYALDDEINVGHKVTKDKLLEAIDGHVLGEAVLIAIF
ncbi:hypothetical protein V2J09_006752 [Rumex salicifolius]